ncbi:hypothetical protein M569_08457, partial [Genlisea aurea]
MDSSVERRLKLIQAHLTPDADGSSSRISANPTAGEFVHDQTYSVVLPEKLQTGKWNVYRSAHSPLKLVKRFPDNPDIATLHDNFVRAVNNFRDYKYLGTRVQLDGTVGEYKWMTYGEASTARAAIGSGLYQLGLRPGGCVGVYFTNRPEWLVVDHACAAYSFISVPLYDTLGPDAGKFIVNHAGIEVIFCVPSTLNTLLGFLSEIPSVRVIVVVGGIDEHLPSLHSTSGVKLLSYTSLLNQGSNNLVSFFPPKPEDVATVCYTSGTTGTPKGVVLSHENLIASVAGMVVKLEFYPTDVYLSYLPLAHIYERSFQILTAYCGVAIGFYQGDTMKLMDDIASLRPTIFASVPRIYNRIYDGIISAVRSSGVLKERLFNVAYNSKRQAIIAGRKPAAIWDRLIFNKIKDKLGGRVRYMASGASPLSADVMEFLRVCFGCDLVEGYGMTETSCVVTSTDIGDHSTGHVGSPNPASEVKLVDVPEMNYTAEDQPYPRGEICVRGPAVFRGYYRDEIQTREVLDEEGWLHTGDIGLWLPSGRLKIIDRKKNIFKLAQGEYIAPEKIENVYAKCKFVSQCFVYGDSLNSSLVGVVCVDQDVLRDWASSLGIRCDDLEQVCRDPRARAAVLAEMDNVGKLAQV